MPQLSIFVIWYALLPVCVSYIATNTHIVTYNDAIIHIFHLLCSIDLYLSPLMTISLEYVTYYALFTSISHLYCHKHPYCPL